MTKEVYCISTECLEPKEIDRVIIDGDDVRCYYAKGTNIVSGHYSERLGLFYDIDNSHQFANELKIWAFTHGYALAVHLRADLTASDRPHFYVVKLGTGSDRRAGVSYNSSEPEAVFEAIEYVLKDMKKRLLKDSKDGK